MAFVKLDCGMLDSTLWVDRDAREVFITALLMADPFEITAPAPQIKIRSLELTGWEVPAGWYGFVAAASTGICRRAGIEVERGLDALMRLGDPDLDSRSPEFDGRRLARIDSGFVVLNFMKYRDRDYTAPDRMRRYRERLKQSKPDSQPLHRNVTVLPVTMRNVTHSEAEAEAEADKKTKRGRFAPPTLEMVKLQAAKIALPEEEALAMHAHYETNGWRTNAGPVKSWVAALTKWQANWRKWSKQGKGSNGTYQRTNKPNPRHSGMQVDEAKFSADTVATVERRRQERLAARAAAESSAPTLPL